MNYINIYSSYLLAAVIFFFSGCSLSYMVFGDRYQLYRVNDKHEGEVIVFRVDTKLGVPDNVKDSELNSYIEPILKQKLKEQNLCQYSYLAVISDVSTWCTWNITCLSEGEEQKKLTGCPEGMKFQE